MAVINIPGQEPWVVARWAFRKVLTAAVRELPTRPDLEHKLEAAQALDGLRFSGIDAADALVLAGAVFKAAGDVAAEESQKDTALARSFVEMLTELRALLRETYNLA